MKNALKVTGLFTFLVIAFLNVFIDLGHIIVIQETLFKSFEGADLLINSSIAIGLFLLPFILLFTPAGFFSDKHPKNKVMRYSAWVSVGISALITLSYYQGWFWVAMGMTFLLATQSAFHSPAKYGYLKELVGDRRLTQANGLLQVATVFGILLGIALFYSFFENLIKDSTILTAKVLATEPNNILKIIAPVGWLLIILSIIELVAAYQLPQITKAREKMSFRRHEYIRGRTQARTLKIIKRHPYIWLSILGLAVFWSIIQVLIFSYPAYAQAHLNLSTTSALKGLLIFSGLGLIIGSITSGRVSRNHIEMGLVPVGAVGITISLILVHVFDSSLWQAANFLFLGIMGGFFIVPLNALIQYHAKNNQLGRILASKNLIQFSVMLLFLVISSLLAYMQLDSTVTLWSLFGIALLGSIYTILKIPESLLRFVIARIFAARYRMKVLGFEDLPHSGGVLLLGNHISWVDWALVQIASPRPLHFVIERGYYELWYLKGVLKLFGAIPIASAGSASSLETINSLLKEGKAVCLFPEGTISRTGQLSEFKRGYQKTIEGTKAKIVPFYLHGLWGSRFSRSSGYLKEARQSGFKRDIIVAFGKPMPTDTTPDQLKRRVFDMSFTSWQAYSKTLDTIPVSWLKTAKRMSFRMAATDVIGEPLSHHKFITAVFAFSGLIAKKSPEQNIGLLVPASVGGAITNMAVLVLGKTAVNLNFTSSAEALQGSVKSAEIKTVYTSKKFIRKLNDRGIKIKEILPDTKLIYLEDFKAELSKAKMLLTLLGAMLLPAKVLQWIYIKRVDLEDTAAILFSSGSEGIPKGVELTHLNLATNSRQVADMLNTRENDVVMSTLPTFHAFGLLATTFMPLSEGIPIVCHPDPTDVVTIAKGVARNEATLLFGTSTFLRLYTMNKKVHPLMLKSLRLVIAGAEKLNPVIRDAFGAKFNKVVLEGYGTTETSPVASVNIPDELDTNYWKPQLGNRFGTVGMALPGTSFRIVDPSTMQELHTGEDGLILIGGPQVMKGYLNDPERTTEVITEIDGQRWYHSGDKGHLDNDGFLVIVDRYSRFAKLGGEMVSLSAVEETIRNALNDEELDLVAVNVPDDKKGEKVILLIASEVPAKDLKKALIDADMNPLMIPAKFISVNAVPKLGSGKTDFATSKKVALGKLGA
jgi:acyl-[acyl-carrier-protein]-phospholipid O-acyltransferase/long-chain-fatty-acid--[acyl-carrier-protein] ligase